MAQNFKAESTNRRQFWLACALLGAMVLAVYSNALQCIFVALDDPDYITENLSVQRGLNWASLRWAFTTNHAANWHPLTWLSHILDCQLYGLAPVGHHLTSLLLHLANSLLLLVLLHRLTGAVWRSAWVAAMFALHPLRVESVVWVAERKDVLSTFFWMLTVLAYVRYAQNLKTQNANRKSPYLLALVFFACGLMAKSMVVTLPFVLLLLDFWPLARCRDLSVVEGPEADGRARLLPSHGGNGLLALLLEKIPFLLLAIGASVVTFLIQDRSGVVASLSTVSLGERLSNIPVAYVRYLGKIFWPSGLAVFYGFQHWSFLEVGGAVLLLGLVTGWALWQGRARPYLAVGWFWFLGMLVPTIGLVQVGHQSMADRYSYLPSAGIFLMAAWFIGELVLHRPALLKTATALGAISVVACALLTCRQITFWINPSVLYARAADISNQDYLTCYNVGCEVMAQGNLPRAVRCFERALKVADAAAPASFLARTHNNLGCALLGQGQVEGAVSNFESALKLQPRFPEVYYNMGRAFMSNNQSEVAVDCFQRALTLDPAVAETHYKLANALALVGRPADAIAQYSQALQLRPGMDEAANNLALLLATCPNQSLRDGPRAVALARQACEHSHDQNPLILGTLAAAYAETGRFSDALTTAQQARQLALAQNNKPLAAALEGQLRSYQERAGGRSP